MPREPSLATHLLRIRISSGIVVPPSTAGYRQAKMRRTIIRKTNNPLENPFEKGLRQETGSQVFQI